MYQYQQSWLKKEQEVSAHLWLKKEALKIAILDNPPLWHSDRCRPYQPRKESWTMSTLIQEAEMAILIVQYVKEKYCTRRQQETRSQLSGGTSSPGPHSHQRRQPSRLKELKQREPNEPDHTLWIRELKLLNRSRGRT